MSNIEIISKAIQTLRDNVVRDENNNIDYNLFLYFTELFPNITIEVIIRDSTGRVLLLWRDDEQFGQGWHLPGGILRLGETMKFRHDNVLKNECGLDPKQDIISSVFHKEIEQYFEYRRNRKHGISFVYNVKVNNDIKIGNDAKWFSEIPDNILKEHMIYIKEYNLF